MSLLFHVSTNDIANIMICVACSAQIPGMGWVLTYADGKMKLLVNAYLPVVLLLSLMMLLPLIFERVAFSYEKRKIKSDVDQFVVGRYFYYQVCH